MQINTAKWVKICLFNLGFVSLFGMMMRYKIAYSFPLLDQKHLQHAHSHFAFSGWVSMLLMVLMIQVISKTLTQKVGRQFNSLLIVSVILAYGMLLSFAIQGYGLFSISFATTSVLLSFVFCWMFYTHSRKEINLPGKNWFYAALVFNVLSALGTFYLSYMMASKNMDQHAYLASVYWYLHFQYNGWFFFACAGLLINFLSVKSLSLIGENKAFKALAISCIPAYGLSVLWAELPFWVYIVIVIASMVQLYGWVQLLLVFIRAHIFEKLKLPSLGKFLLIFVALAYSVKILLQTGSVIPELSKLAFGFRPIVIAYLHLVLLASISIYLITHVYITKNFSVNNLTRKGIIIFTMGVFLNELVLAIQGVASLDYVMVPYVNETLLGVSIFIFIGIITMLWPTKESLLEG